VLEIFDDITVAGLSDLVGFDLIDATLAARA